MWKKIFLLFILTCTFINISPAYALEQYTINRIDFYGDDQYFSPVSINESGQVGGAFQVGSNSYGALYSSGTLACFGSLGGSLRGAYSTATGINDSGQVVGSAYTADSYLRAALFSNGTVTNLGVLEGGDHSDALSINNSGLAVGYSMTSSNNFTAVLFASGTVTDLGTLPGGTESEALSINSQGLAAGWSVNSSGNEHAALFSNGTVTDLGTLQDDVMSHALCINDSGLAVGYSGVYQGLGSSAVLFGNGTVTELGKLPNGLYSWANSINNLGQSVGWSSNANDEMRAVLFSNGEVIDLNTLVNLPAGWTLVEARGINDAGQIIGIGTVNGYSTLSFMLTPMAAVPIPPTVLIFGPALFGLWGMRRRMIKD